MATLKSIIQKYSTNGIINKVTQEELLQAILEISDYSQNESNITNAPKCYTLKQKEDIRIRKLCDNINNNTKLGIKLKESFFKFYDKQIDNAIKVGGNKDHYDIKIIHTDI